MFLSKLIVPRYNPRDVIFHISRGWQGEEADRRDFDF